MTEGRPASLFDYTGHGTWVNQAARRRLGIGREVGPFVPEQAIDLATAIACYTSAGAYANFCEQHRGTLTPGKAADLIALSGNLFELPPAQIKDCRVDLTVVGGQVRHQLW